MLNVDSNEKRLTRRYLIWCYKTTKEDLDKIDRYFTQNIVDQFILSHMESDVAFQKDEGYQIKVEEYADYMKKKMRKAESNKFLDETCKDLKSDYCFLVKRLDSVEKAIVNFLGKNALVNIVSDYENEMTRRILEAREHV